MTSFFPDYLVVGCLKLDSPNEKLLLYVFSLPYLLIKKGHMYLLLLSIDIQINFVYSLRPLLCEYNNPLPI